MGTIATGVIERINSNTGEKVLYKEIGTASPHEYIMMSDVLCDGYFFRKKDGKYYARQMTTIDLRGIVGLQEKHVVKDITILLRKAFLIAYFNRTNSTGWASAPRILLPSGSFIVTGSIIKSDDYYASAMMYIIEGEGWQNTSIKFEGPAQSYMFDNNQLFGFATFSGIKFSANSASNLRFMNVVGGGSGNAQSIIFNACYFEGFKRILNVTGDTMASEVSFTDCKIRDAGADAIFFYLDNPQAVNWRFFGTDIENFTGIAFNFKKGASLYYFGGSIIPLSGGIIYNVPADGDSNFFGPGNSPNLTMFGTRIELHNTSQLIKCLAPSTVISLDFYSCGMGGANSTEGQFQVEIMGSGKINFTNCNNFDNYKFKHTLNNTSDYLNPAVITFIGNSPALSSLKQGQCSNVSNKHGSPIYKFINCAPNAEIRIFDPEQITVNGLSDGHSLIMQRVASAGINSNYAAASGLQAGQWRDLFAVSPPDVMLFGLKLIIYDFYLNGVAEGSISVRVIDKNGNERISAKEINTSGVHSLISSENFILLAISETFKVQVQPQTFSGSEFSVKAVLLLTY